MANGKKNERHSLLAYQDTLNEHFKYCCSTHCMKDASIVTGLSLVPVTPFQPLAAVGVSNLGRVDSPSEP